MKILIAEDDRMIAQNLSNALKYYGYEILGPFTKGEEALEAYHKDNPDLALLDIELQDELDGMEVAKQIKQHEPIPIIFITAMLDDATRAKAKSLNAHAFINKPFHERNLFNAIDLALSTFSKETRLQEEAKTPDKAIEETKAIKIKDRFYLKKNEKYVRVNIEDVLFIEASGHYIVVQLKKEQILASSNLSAFLSQLQHPDLIRVHRSFAVNLQNIPDFDETFFYFPQKSIPISRGFKDDLKKRINTF